MKEKIIVLDKYFRTVNYLSAIQIYLQDNFLLERPLSFDDIKPRLLGHWGTAPGINFIYTHLNYLITKHNCSCLFVLGPGHGAAALQANLFLEGTLQKFYPQAEHTSAGIAYSARQFSWPYGFPSHVTPGTPGAILEGGELGYALSTAYGAALDNPDLIIPCVIGDGEAETGPTATAWHLSKFIDPATNGTVLPILHLNGYKIGGPTIFGRMSEQELKDLFTGYGYHPIFVNGVDIHTKMADALEKAYHLIMSFKKKAHGDQKYHHMPMIILKTRKGWTGIQELNKRKIEGNCLAHQVIIEQAKTKKVELNLLSRWLSSYKFSELFSPETGFDPDILSLIPPQELCMGNNSHAYSGRIYSSLELPLMAASEEGVVFRPGEQNMSSMRQVGAYLKDVFKHNKQIRFFSPDEIYSNKLDEILEVTSRAFLLPLRNWDKDLSPDGKVIEMLSEHSLQGLAQGYVITGRHAIFASYEAFIEVIGSMADQYLKFLKVARTYPWRGDFSSLTYIVTSSGWRQEHNGFSHQNPGFVDQLVQKHSPWVHAYFPPDAVSTVAVLRRCLEKRNSVNVVVAGKTDEPCWLTKEQAEREVDQGLAAWDFVSDANPDIVFMSIGDYMTKEVIAAITILKMYAPSVRVRMVNVCELSALANGVSAAGRKVDLLSYITADKPVIINYHGYPAVIKSLLFDIRGHERIQVHGYTEHGSTTTPFDMQVRNGTSRIHLVKEALTLLKAGSVINEKQYESGVQSCEELLRRHDSHIKEFGTDLEEIVKWRFLKK